MRPSPLAVVLLSYSFTLPIEDVEDFSLDYSFRSRAGTNGCD